MQIDSHPSDSVLSDDESRGFSDKLHALHSQLRSVIFGQDELIENVIIGLLARGHLLLEGLPGLGKTELVKALASSLALSMKRIQFTPDLLPGDITGNPFLEESSTGRKLVFRPGPLFANVVIADEINRASPKTQSALLEAMQERRVTALGEVHALPDPFVVLATQNPIELEGTYPLPEAQLDRFLFKLQVGRTSREALERIVSSRSASVPAELSPIFSQEELSTLFAAVSRVFLPPVVIQFIGRLVEATHPGSPGSVQGVRFGASPRAAIGLATAGRARALFHGRVNVGFDDVRVLAPHVLAHRLVLDYSLRLQGKTGRDIVEELLSQVTPHSSGLPSTLAYRSGPSEQPTEGA